MKGLLRAFGIVLVIAVGAFLGYEGLKVRVITVQGVQSRPPSEVVALSGIFYGQSMLKVDKLAARQSIDAFPYYVCEEVELNWPDEVTIRVTERKRAAYILHMNSLIAIDSEGVVLELSMYAQGLTEPVVTGLMASSFVVGKAVAVSDEAQMTALQAVLGALEEAGYLYAVSEINVANVLDLKLVTAEGIVCLLGTSIDLPKKIEWIKAVVPVLYTEYPNLDFSGRQLDVSSGNSASFNVEE